MRRAGKRGGLEGVEAERRVVGIMSESVFFFQAEDGIRDHA
ncbi:hypothetical protein CDFC105_43914 [Clostridioides difficile]|nr:hypothetical protein CDFC105_43914 [Clostridioides difficile]